MPREVSVLWAREVPEAFHARYSALARSYRYLIFNREPRPALLAQRVCWIRDPLDQERMHAAAQRLVGEHDFSSFRAAECQARSPMRHLSRRSRWSGAANFSSIAVTANAFLHHMVRNIAGVLIAIGCGERPIAMDG